MANDITFHLDKYGNPEMLDVKTSVAQQIVNALFMVPGNLPSMPTIGVNIKQYLYRYDTDYVSGEIEAKLKEACGTVISGAFIGSVDFSVQKTTQGESVFLVMVRVTFPNEDTKLLGISVKDANEIIKFNFDYADL